MSKKRGRHEETPKVEKKRKGPPTVTINGIVYAKQQICDETLDLIKMPDGITFPTTPENNSSYKANFTTLETTYDARSSVAGTTSVICKLSPTQILRLTIHKDDFEEELNGLIIQYYLSHQPGSVGICKVYEFGYLLDNSDERKYVYAILENLPVEFYQYIETIKTTSKPIIKQLLEAINFLHSHNISHLDIKPRNIGFTTSDQLKIFDFGLSRVNRSVPFKEQVCNYFSNYVETIFKGTLEYGDPYYIGCGTSSDKSDVYSAGVIIFNMFFHLERGWSDAPIVTKLLKPFSCGVSKCSDSDWNEFFVHQYMRDRSDINTPEKIKSLKNLLYGMLQPNPSSRMTAADALCHPWLDEHMTCGSPRTIISSVVSQKKRKTTSSRGSSSSRGSGSSRSTAKKRKTSSS